MTRVAENLHNPAMETPAPPRGTLVTGHFRADERYDTHRIRGTKDWLLTWTMDGCGGFLLAGRWVEARAGDVVVLAPGTPHHYGTRGAVWDFYWAHVMPPRAAWLPILQAMCDPDGYGRWRLTRAGTQTRLQSALQRMVRDSIRAEPWTDELAHNALEEAIFLLAQDRQQAAIQRRDERVERVLQLLAGSLKRDWRVEALAEEVHLSPSHLAHLFKEETGESVIQALLRLRLRQASKLLAFSARSVAEIAEEVGFHSAYYFTRQFTARYGETPTKYRTRMRQSPVLGDAPAPAPQVD